jgi:hypothetical protein
MSRMDHQHTNELLAKLLKNTLTWNIDIFMKIFLDDFTMFSDWSSHFEKFHKCFQTCKVYGINFNTYKCAFMVLLGMCLGFIIFKESKFLDPKKIHPIVSIIV